MSWSRMSTALYDKRVIILENGSVAADGKMKNSAHRETLGSGRLGTPDADFATKYLNDDDEETAAEPAADTAYANAVSDYSIYLEDSDGGDAR